MGVAYVNAHVTAVSAAAVLLLILSLGGCAASTGSSLMDSRAEIPGSPKTSGYLPVEDLPPKREIMRADEQLKLKKELIDARDRQSASSKAQGSGAPAKTLKSRAVQPTNQSVRP